MLLWTTLSRVGTLLLIASGLACCGAPARDANSESPIVASPLLPTIVISTAQTVETSQPTANTLTTAYAFPTRIDPASRYLFYLHGRIIEDQGFPAISPEFGEYHYDEILGALESYGFVVISEQRPQNADVLEYAQRTAQQVTDLLTDGVPPGSITVVGASKGASIAVGVSYLMGNPEVNYVLLATCHPSLIDEWLQQSITLSGNVLAIRDYADDEYSGSCTELFEESEGKGLSRFEKIELQVGTGHGILYDPLPEWVLPTVYWAYQQW